MGLFKSANKESKREWKQSSPESRAKAESEAELVSMKASQEARPISASRGVYLVNAEVNGEEGTFAILSNGVYLEELELGLIEGVYRLELVQAADEE